MRKRSMQPMMEATDVITAVMTSETQFTHGAFGHDTHTNVKEFGGSETDLEEDPEEAVAGASVKALSDAGTFENLDGMDRGDDPVFITWLRSFEGVYDNCEDDCEGRHDDLARQHAEENRGHRTPHKNKLDMDRLDAAINAAIAAGMNDPNSSNAPRDVGSHGQRFINACPWFVSDYSYVIPWAACYSWKVVQVLLKAWALEDGRVLSDISNGDITVWAPDHGYIHPETWEQIIQHDMRVHFYPHSAYKEAKHECRIQYTVDYFEGTTADNIFKAQHTFDQPVEVAHADDDVTLPALEEIKDVVTPHYRHSENNRHGKVDSKAALGSQDRVVYTKLKINSSYLLNLLKSIIEYPGECREEFGLEAGLYLYPFEDLYHHLDQLLEYKTDGSRLRAQHSAAFNQKCDEHIELLRAYLMVQSGVPFENFQSLQERRVPVVSFKNYWLLLKPGADVYVRESDGSLNVYVLDEVQCIPTPTHDTRSIRDYTIAVWNLAFGGTHITPRRRYIEVKVFDNEREITSLVVFPVKFHDENDKGRLREELVSRGRRYFHYSKRPCFLEYTGKGVKEVSKAYKRTRVVVEHETAPWELDGLESDHHAPADDAEVLRNTIRVPQCECNDCKTRTTEIYVKERFNDYHAIVPSDTAELTEHHYLLMASHMYAFILNERIYDILEVKGLAEPSMADNAIDKLVMDAKSKDLIKAVADIYTDGDQSKRFTADYIQGKGEGQIILLHGSPGTGKTLTAESVAEYTRRPLLSITASDLGHEPAELESRLLRYFKRSRDWDAIVLLDEADVYLEQRTTHDLKRNGIVTVFLRALDYFQGILFLTTNRVGHFDEAFISRIHLSLGYEKLTDVARAKIWDNLFKKLSHDSKRGGFVIKYEYDAKSYVKSKEVQALEWNGREIRNAFQTAVALAVHRAKGEKNDDPPEMVEDDLKQVVTMSSAFRKYMTAAHSGMDDSTWAFKHGNREDKFPSTPAKTDG